MEKAYWMMEEKGSYDIHSSAFCYCDKILKMTNLLEGKALFWFAAAVRNYLVLLFWTCGNPLLHDKNKRWRKSLFMAAGDMKAREKEMKN